MTGLYHREDGRTWLLCPGCGHLYLSALPDEQATASCHRCGKPSAGFVVASRQQFDAAVEGITVSVVNWL